MCKMRAFAASSSFPTFFEDERIVTKTARENATLFGIDGVYQLAHFASRNAVENFLHSPLRICASLSIVQLIHGGPGRT